MAGPFMTPGHICPAMYKLEQSSQITLKLMKLLAYRQKVFQFQPNNWEKSKPILGILIGFILD